MVNSFGASQVERSYWTRLLAWFAGSLVVVNVFAFVAVPSLFELDRARGPYTEANNFELTRVYSRAIDGYENIISRFPDSRYAALSEIGIANSLLGFGRRDEAIERFQELLVVLKDDPDYETYRLTILGRLSTAYQDAGNGDGFREVFAALTEEYPDAEVTRRAQRFATELDAAEAAAAAGSSGVSEGVVITLPNDIREDQTLDVTISVSPDVVDPGALGLAVNLAFWDGFSLVSTSPPAKSTAEFWGKRFFNYTMPDNVPLDVTLTLRAGAPGIYVLDLDLERSFEIIEIGQRLELEVSAP